jgi:hypothetical protein
MILVGYSESEVGIFLAQAENGQKEGVGMWA